MTATIEIFSRHCFAEPVYAEGQASQHGADFVPHLAVLGIRPSRLMQPSRYAV